MGDRFPSQVKAAVLDAVGALLRSCGSLLKGFLPPLQTTFSKALQDSSEIVRDRALAAFQDLLPLVARADPLVKDLLAGITTAFAVESEEAGGGGGGAADTTGKRLTLTAALRGTVEVCGRSKRGLSAKVRKSIRAAALDLLLGDEDAGTEAKAIDETVRAAAAGVYGEVWAIAAALPSSLSAVPDACLQPIYCIPLIMPSTGALAPFAADDGELEAMVERVASASDEFDEDGVDESARALMAAEVLCHAAGNTRIAPYHADLAAEFAGRLARSPDAAVRANVSQALARLAVHLFSYGGEDSDAEGMLTKVVNTLLSTAGEAEESASARAAALDAVKDLAKAAAEGGEPFGELLGSTQRLGKSVLVVSASLGFKSISVRSAAQRAMCILLRYGDDNDVHPAEKVGLQSCTIMFTMAMRVVKFDWISFSNTRYPHSHTLTTTTTTRS